MVDGSVSLDPPRPLLADPMPELPVDMALLKPKLINELQNLSNSKLSFFWFIFILKETI